MRLLLVSGAGSIHTIRWANAFAGAGIEVHLVSQYPPVEPLDHMVVLYRFPHIFGAGYITNGPRVRRLIRDIRPDIVNVHYASGSGTLGRWILNVPYVLNVWGADVYDFPKKSQLHRWLVCGNLTRADVVASTSQVMADWVRSLCPSLGSIVVTPFGVDTAHFAPKSSKRSPAATISEERLLVGTVKRLARKYGIDTLLHAFRILVDKLERSHPALSRTLELRIVGDGPERLSLENLAADLDIHTRTTFAGHVPHVRISQELALLDIFCALSRKDSESFGVAAIEASAVGLPVVVSDVGGLPEVVIDGETGIIVPKDDPEAAAGALEKLVLSARLREKMGNSGTQHVMQKYEWSVCVKRMITLFGDTIRNWEARA